MKISSDILDAPIQVHSPAQGGGGQPTTLREALGPRATIVLFVRHFG